MHACRYSPVHALLAYMHYYNNLLSMGVDIIISISNYILRNNSNRNNLFKVMTQGVVAHSPKPGAHDKSAGQKNTKIQKLKN